MKNPTRNPTSVKPAYGLLIQLSFGILQKKVRLRGLPWFPATILTISTSLILLASLVVVSIITLATVDIPLTTMKLDAFVGYVVRSEVSVTRKIAALTGHQHQMDSKFITMHY